MRSQRLDLNLLVTLDALLTERSVSLAARKVHLTQPAVSHALARLRQHYNDELLVMNGRVSVLTPLAQELIGPLRETLTLVDRVAAGTAGFDPGTSVRRFVIRTSDYSLWVGGASAVGRMKAVAPNITFDVFQPSDHLYRVERGEVDISILPQQLVVPDHPSVQLYEDEYVVVVWSDSPVAKEEIDLDRYSEMGHVAVRFGADQDAGQAEALTLSPPCARRIEITVPSFMLVPMMLAGTDLAGSMPRRLAEIAARTAPLTIKPVPFAAPKFVECVQWSKLRRNDPALTWVVEQLQTSMT